MRPTLIGIPAALALLLVASGCPGGEGGELSCFSDNDCPPGCACDIEFDEPSGLCRLGTEGAYCGGSCDRETLCPEGTSCDTDTELGRSPMFFHCLPDSGAGGNGGNGGAGGSGGSAGGNNRITFINVSALQGITVEVSVGTTTYPSVELEDVGTNFVIDAGVGTAIDVSVTWQDPLTSDVYTASITCVVTMDAVVPDMKLQTFVDVEIDQQVPKQVLVWCGEGLTEES